MQTTTSEIIGVFASIVTLAMLSVAVVNGKGVAAIFKGFGDAFSGSIEAATGKAI